jgi:hypothetical protein
VFEERTKRTNGFHRPAGRKTLKKNDKEILRVNAFVLVEKRG